MHSTYNLHAAKNRPMLSKFLSQLSRINVVHGRNVALLEPVAQTLHGGPVRVLPRVARHDEAGDVDARRLEELGQAVLVNDILVGDAVVANQRVRQDEDLAPVARIRKGLGVSDHARVEDHLPPSQGLERPEAVPADRGAPVGKVQQRKLALRDTFKEYEKCCSDAKAL